MSVEFRQRTPSEYVKIAWKRKWLIILPAIAITTAISWVVYRLPDLYESSTLIVVKPATLPGIVPTLTDAGLTRQLTSIAQVVTSRSSLEPLIEKYDLYKSERQHGVPMEAIVDTIRSNIRVEVNTSRNDITNGFNIAYRGRVPQTTQAIAAELARKYTDEQTKTTINSSESAKQFIDQQVRQTKEEIDAIEKQRLEFMEKNLENLPDGAQSLLSQLNGLRQQQGAYINELGRYQDRRAAMATELALLKKSTAQIKEDIIENTTDPKTTLAWSNLAARKADLQAQLTRMRIELREKHPDVISKQAELDSVNQSMSQMIGEWQQKIKDKEERVKKYPDMQIFNLETQIKLVDGEIKRMQGILDGFDKQIQPLMQRINNVPGVQVALGAIDREYQIKRSAYDQLLDQQRRIALGADAVTQQQGETIQVIDAANLPSIPVAPKRFMLFVVALALGMGVGLSLAGLVEVPRLLTIQTTEDAAHYTNLPVLVSLPELLTAREARSRPLRRRLLLAAGVVATILATPALAIVLKMSQIFDRFAV